MCMPDRACTTGQAHMPPVPHNICSDGNKYLPLNFVTPKLVRVHFLGAHLFAVHEEADVLDPLGDGIVVLLQNVRNDDGVRSSGRRPSGHGVLDRVILVGLQAARYASVMLNVYEIRLETVHVETLHAACSSEV